MLDDETLGCCPIGPRLLAYGLIHIADDDGRFRASPTFLKARVFAYNDDLDQAEVSEWLNHLAAVGFVELYRDTEQSYGWMPRWRKHQKIDRPSPSLLPAPEACEPIAAVIIPGAFADRSTSPREDSSNIATYTDTLGISHQQRDSGEFDERSTRPREDSPPEGKGQKGKGEEGSTTAAAVGTQHLPSVVQHVLNVLDTHPSWMVDDIRTRGQVENSLAAGGQEIAVEVAHEAVAWRWADCKLDDPGAAFRVVLRQHRDGARRKAEGGRPTREHPAERAIRELDALIPDVEAA